MFRLLLLTIIPALAFSFNFPGTHTGVVLKPSERVVALKPKHLAPAAFVTFSPLIALAEEVRSFKYVNPRL
jgi:hypothetical protein